MPKISCYCKKFFEGRYFPFVSFVIRSNRLFGTVKALIDTGSPFTVLSPLDALRFRLPINSMRKGYSVKLAGFNFFKYPLNNTTFSFKTQCPKGKYFDVSDFGVLVPTKKGLMKNKFIMAIPSIIGINFLEEHGLSLFFDPKKKLCCLEY